MPCSRILFGLIASQDCVWFQSPSGHRDDVSWPEEPGFSAPCLSGVRAPLSAPPPQLSFLGRQAWCWARWATWPMSLSQACMGLACGCPGTGLQWTHSSRLVCGTGPRAAEGWGVRLPCSAGPGESSCGALSLLSFWLEPRAWVGGWAGACSWAGATAKAEAWSRGGWKWPGGGLQA